MAENTCGIRLCRETRDRLRAMELVLREADHRIANALQTVMAASAVDTVPTDVVSAAARDQMMTRISAIALVHRMLSVSTTFGTISIGEYLTNLAESIGMLWSGLGGARVAVHHGGEKIAADVAARLGMVVNELVTNSFKHAYGNGTGEIRVGFSVMNGSFVLIVADDGRGIEAAPARRRGMGSRLIEDIAKQLNASFSYQLARPGTVAVLSGPADVLLPSGGNIRVISVADPCSEITHQARNRGRIGGEAVDQYHRADQRNERQESEEGHVGRDQRDSIILRISEVDRCAVRPPGLAQDR